MSNIVGLLAQIAVTLQPAPRDVALELIRGFVGAVQRSPEHAKEFASSGASIDSGDFAGGRSIDTFARAASKCALQSISQPAVPVNWKLDGARYFKVVWRCPPPFGPREGSVLSVDLFVREKIVAGRGRYYDE